MYFETKFRNSRMASQTFSAKTLIFILQCGGDCLEKAFPTVVGIKVFEAFVFRVREIVAYDFVGYEIWKFFVEIEKLHVKYARLFDVGFFHEFVGRKTGDSAKV